MIKFGTQDRLFQVPQLLEVIRSKSKVPPMVMPFWANSDNDFAFRKENFTEGKYFEVDPLQVSNVYYQLYNSGQILNNASLDVNNKLNKTFEATWVLVVTWVNIYPFDTREQQLYPPFVSTSFATYLYFLPLSRHMVKDLNCLMPGSCFTLVFHSDSPHILKNSAWWAWRTLKLTTFK